MSNDLNFHYVNHHLHVESVPLHEIAKQFGTPCYVYSKAAILKNWQAFDNAFGDTPHRICYAVKANSNIAILNLLATMQSGFDIVSVGELERVIKAHGDPTRVVFSGIGKNAAEISRALDLNIYCFDVESEAELDQIQKIAAAKNKIAPIAFRVNPNIDARTHPYIATGLHENKFGIDIQEIPAISQKAKSLSHVKLMGLACHIGSQITEIEPFLEAIDSLLVLIDLLTQEGITIQHINLGGGLGIRYRDEAIISPKDYIAALLKKLSTHKLEILLEPGRAIIGDAGILLTRVEYLKKTPEKNFAIVDAAMNDLIRPALYEAWHPIIPVAPHSRTPETIYDIVGPVCETADFLGKNRNLSLEANDLLAILNAGAYGFSMSSTYNSRPRAAEILVDGNKIHLIRERETIAELFAKEILVDG